jgi:exodeoxyribonuclease VII large subunit
MMIEPEFNSAPAPRIWSVGALCRAVADALNARFNPVAVQGEISGFTRAASGHCYFTLKDAQGQLRCAMFKRVAQMQSFFPAEGDLVEIRGRLGVYEPRGELQLIVESVQLAGQGTLYEQFVRLKDKLQGLGWFDAERKRPLRTQPRAIGVVTSLGAAALHDVVTALKRRVPHIPVVVSPASVQGAQAPAELVQALHALTQQPQIDVILLIRGGGSLEDLWAFNDEQLARAIVQSPIPVVSGVGHETDFTIADFCADLRAPTPTAAAELCAVPKDEWVARLRLIQSSLQETVWRVLDQQEQRLDRIQNRLGRPSQGVSHEKLKLSRLSQRLQHVAQQRIQKERHQLDQRLTGWRRSLSVVPERARDRLSQADMRLRLLDPKLVLQRGYALLSDTHGQAITSAKALAPAQQVQATLADGRVDLVVRAKADT